MFSSRSGIVHREVIELQARPEQVREFITTPERILDYYPSPIEGGVIEQGRKIYCLGKAGVSLLEVVPEQSNEQLLVIKVTTASNIKPPYSEERIYAARFFTMYEDWQMEKTTQGTRLTKTWRDIEKHKMKYLPMGLIVRRSAKAESNELRIAWDRAAGN
ncbi:MAG: hypothetical protein V7754_15795 [Halioglobus sp.]